MKNMEVMVVLSSIAEAQMVPFRLLAQWLSISAGGGFC
jgi:hypothetical protein